MKELELVRVDPVYVRSDFHCVYCGRDLLADFDLFVTMGRDHLVPKAKGGSDGTQNRVTACAVCDKIKGASRPNDLRDARLIVAEKRIHWQRHHHAIRASMRGEQCISATARLL